MYYGEFNDSFPPQTDGVAQTTLNYTKWLNEMASVRACAVAPQFARAMDHNYDFPVIRFISIPLFLAKDYMLGLPEIAFRTTIKLDSLPLDLVHAHCPFASGTLALMTARRKNVPLVATFHSKFADDFAQRLKMEAAGEIAAKYVATFFSQADEVWAVNASSARTLANYGYRGPVKAMPNGCDFDTLQRTPQMRAQVLQRFELTDKPLLLFVGRMAEQKNIPILLKAFTQMQTDCNLMLVGDGERLGSYRRLAEELGVASRVRFPGTVHDRELLRSIYASADLFCLPSIYDNAPLVVREAAACGTPSALIEGSDSAEGIVDGVNGFTSALDVAAYTRTLDAALSNHERLRAAGDEARKTVYMSWQTVVGIAESRYREVIAEYKAKQAVAQGKRRYYSISSVIAQELFNKQVVRMRFTGHRVNRLAKRQTRIARDRTQRLQHVTLMKIKDLRLSMMDKLRK